MYKEYIQDKNMLQLFYPPLYGEINISFQAE